MSLARVLSKIATLVTISGSNLAVAGEISGPKGVARAWVAFDATRNAAGGSDTANTARFILASYNVTSVTKSAAGNHTLAIPSGVLADGDYGVLGTGRGSANVTLDPSGTNTATACYVTTRVSTSGALNDAPYNMVAIFD